MAGEKIVVVGSSNTDMVVKTARIPRPGETVMGGDFTVVAGGKGANQAVAAAKLGADVTFVASIGRDDFGDKSVNGFRSLGIRTDYIIRDETSPSGVALIFVDVKGENVIAVAPGSNANLLPVHILPASEAISAAGVLVVQLEVPVETVACAVGLAKESGVTTILNPAPALKLPEEIFSRIDVFTPNETEGAVYAGVEPGTDPVEIAGKLLDKGVGAVVMTLGARGSLVVTPAFQEMVPAPRVVPVDTTAAGDAFNGALAVGLSEGRSLLEAARFASCVAALSVTRMGAQPSMPERAEVEKFVATLGR